MVNPLQISAALFSTVVVSAYYAQCAVYHHLFLLVTVFSVWYHSTHDSCIAIIDKCVAHIAFMTVIWLDFPKLKKKNSWLVLFPLGVLLLWICEVWIMKKKKEEPTPLATPLIIQRIHVCLHLIAIIGLHCFIFQLYSPVIEDL